MAKDRVVLVVDGAKRRALLRLALEVSGRFVVAGLAVDEHDAVAVVEDIQPDIVLLDLARRGDEGLALVGEIGVAAPGARVVLVSALVARYHAAHVPGRLPGGPRPAELVRELVDVLAGVTRRADPVPA